MDALRRLAAGTAVIASFTLAACGTAPTAAVIPAAHSPKGAIADLVRAPAATATAAAITPCVEGKLPPAASRLASPNDYPTSEPHLTVVPAAVRPKVSAATAFARVQYWYHPGTGACGLTETLAYWSGDTPATIPADCVPNATTTEWVAPSNCPSTPVYSHVLAWVFTWRSDCDSLGGPAPPVGATPRPAPSLPPLACTSITFVDATTGAPSDYLTTG